MVYEILFRKLVILNKKTCRFVETKNGKSKYVKLFAVRTISCEFFGKIHFKYSVGVFFKANCSYKC